MTLESIHPPEKNSLRKNNYFIKEIQFSEGINLTTVVLSAEIIRELAKAESCIILGRCANYLLAGHPNVLRLFIHAPLEARLARVASYSLAWSQREVARQSGWRTSAAPPTTITIPVRSGGTLRVMTSPWTLRPWGRTAVWSWCEDFCPFFRGAIMEQCRLY